jgi:membrane fusion protein, multidrug efflux system
VVAVGTELFTVIDPSSVRLEASVPSNELSKVRLGNPVQFTVTGYPEPFRGRVERVTPEADPVTRQIRILVMIPDAPAGLPAGLFAEGRVVSRAAVGVIVPADAVSLEDPPWVLRVRDGRVERVNVSIGLTDDLTERMLLASGVVNNDILLRGTDQAITPGTTVDIGR